MTNPLGETAQVVEGPPLDAQAFATALDILEDEMVGLIDLYLENAKDLLGQLDRGHRDGDAASLVRAAHTLRSSSANVGALELSRLCGLAEEAGRGGGLEAARPLVSAIREESERVRDALLVERHALATGAHRG